MLCRFAHHLVRGRGADLNYSAPGSRGRTPLMKAACYGHAAVVAYLLGRGVQVDTCDDSGMDAMKASDAPAQQRPLVAQRRAAFGRAEAALLGS